MSSENYMLMIVHDNIESMLQNTLLTTGNTVSVLGYYEANDGGGDRFYIVDETSQEIDNGNAFKLNNGLYAIRIIDEIDQTIPVIKYGVRPNNVDDTEQLCCCIKNNKNVIFGLNESYKINRTIETIQPHGTIDLNDSIIITTSGHTVFNVNSDDLTIKNGKIRNDNYTSLNPLIYEEDTATNFTLSNVELFSSSKFIVLQHNPDIPKYATFDTIMGCRFSTIANASKQNENNIGIESYKPNLVVAQCQFDTIYNPICAKKSTGNEEIMISDCSFDYDASKIASSNLKSPFISSVITSFGVDVILQYSEIKNYSSTIKWVDKIGKTMIKSIKIDMSEYAFEYGYFFYFDTLSGMNTATIEIHDSIESYNSDESGEASYFNLIFSNVDISSINKIKFENNLLDDYDNAPKDSKKEAIKMLASTLAKIKEGSLTTKEEIEESLKSLLKII